MTNEPSSPIARPVPGGEAPSTVAELLVHATERFGDRPALHAGERTWTYGELARGSAALAGRLAERGVTCGDRVAVLDWNSPAYVEATFAVASLGAVLQPLNPRLARRELEAILGDARTRAVLAGAPFEGTAMELVGRVGSLEAVLVADREPSPVGGAPLERAPRVPVTPDDLAHLYYTSGTTGRPKGVCLTHANVCLHAAAAARELSLGPDDAWGHFAPMFHLADAWATLAVTLVGGQHVIVPRFDAGDVLASIAEHGVTVTNLVPTMLTRLVACAGERVAGGDAPDTRSLRLVLSGGAPITPALVRRVLETFGCEYAQTYGMTETSPYLTLGLLSDALRALPEDEVLRYRARTGRPFAGVELEVVDASDRPVPADDCTVGEIRVRGGTVSPGYWERPEETARVFRDGWLYTGDLAVIDAAGYVDIVDRKKDMIVTGGENVYSTEVENALAEHPGVLEAAAFGRPDATWGEVVCAAVVPCGGGAPAVEELVAHCRERLAAYKCPRHVWLLAELPRTGSGKVSKARLREALLVEPEPRGPMVAGDAGEAR